MNATVLKCQYRRRHYDESEAVGYDNKTVLVKVKDSFSSAMLGELSYKSAEALYKGSKWYAVKLASGNAEEAVAYGLVDKVIAHRP